MTENDQPNNFLSPQELFLSIVFWGGALAAGAVAVLFALGAQGSYHMFHYLVSIAP